MALLAFSNLIKIDRRRSRTQARSRHLACFLRQYWNKAPLLVQTVVVGPLDHIHALGCPTTRDIKYQVAIAVHNLIVRTVRNQAPLLVQTAVVGPLDHLRAGICATSGDIHDQAAIAIHNLVVPGGSAGGEVTAANRVAPLLLHNIRILVPEHVRALEIARSKRPGT